MLHTCIASVMSPGIKLSRILFPFSPSLAFFLSPSLSHRIYSFFTFSLSLSLDTFINLIAESFLIMISLNV